MKRISPQEIQFRRNNNHFCKYGVKYALGFVCRLKHLNFILADDEDEKWEFLDVLGKQDDHTGHPGNVKKLTVACVIDPTTQDDYVYEKGLLKCKRKIHVGKEKGLRKKIVHSLHSLPLGDHSSGIVVCKELKLSSIGPW
ncbi:hypothetical protein ACH5RR_032798 [Cinchona calisaya]|uniref:Uncharacterized protein n=1 Tax=Cinchona calisaya TaxID=153742 RepID=A0ABD2YL55_9GENT